MPWVSCSHTMHRALDSTIAALSGGALPPDQAAGKPSQVSQVMSRWLPLSTAEDRAEVSMYWSAVPSSLNQKWGVARPGVLKKAWAVSLDQAATAV